MKIINLLPNTLPLISIVFFFTFYAITAFSQIHNQLGLPDGAKARLGKGSIKQIKYSPDGKYLAVATSIGVWLYDVNTLQAVDLLIGHDAPVTSIAFCSDGQTLASGGEDNIIVFWDIKTRKIKEKCVGFDKDINLLTFSPSGDTVACKSRSWFIELLNARTGKHIRTVKNTSNTDIKAIAFSPEDNMLITVGYCERNTSYIEYWDIGIGELIRDILIETNITEAAFSPDNKILAVTGKNSHPLQLWDVKTGKHLNSAEKSDVSYEYIAFSHDGSRLVTGGAWEYVSIWDVSTVDQLYNMTEGEPINSVAYAPDGGTIACGIDDGTIQIWDTSSGKLQNTIKGHLDSSIFSAAFSPDGNTLACGAASKVLFWDPHTYEHLKTTKEPHCNVVDIAYSPDGKIIATVGTSMKALKARLWDGQSGRFLGSFIGNHKKYFYRAYRDRDKFTSVSFSPDGSILATGDTDNEVCLWEIRTGEQYLIGEQLATFTDHVETVTSVAFSPDGKTLVSGSLDKTIRFWDVKARKHLKEITGHEKGVNVLAFSPDGKILASGSEDGTIRLWKIDDYELLYAPIANTDNVKALVFSPDGKMLTSINSDSKYINFWNVQTGKLMHTFSGHTQLINSIVYSPDGKVLASVSNDDTVLLWDLTKLVSANK